MNIRLIAFITLAIFVYNAVFLLHPVYPNIDALIHYRWSAQYLTALVGGAAPPRWAPLDNGGLGAPVFLFYPPAFYLFAAPLMAAVPDLALALRLSVALVSVALVVAVAVSQRAAFGPRSWLLALLVLWAPADFMVGGFIQAWPWYLSLIPAYLFVAASVRQMRSGAAFSPAVAVWLAVLCVCHPLNGFMALIAVPFAWLRRVIGARFGWPVLRAALGWGGAVALGLALAAAYLLPSLTLQHLVNPDGWRDAGGIGWRQSFALPLFGHPYWARLMWVVPAATYALAALVLVWLLRTRHLARPGAADWLCVALPCLVLASQASWPIWAIPSPLHMLQRPFRFLPIAAFATLTAAWYMLPDRRWRRPALALMALMVASTVAMQVQVARLDDGQKLVPARFAETFGAPEYLPALRGPEWRGYLDEGGLTDDCRRLRITCTSDGAQRWTFRATAPASVRLPLFAFPAWRLSRDGVAAGSAVDPATGLIQITIPAGETTVAAAWRALPAERLGAGISLAAALGLLGVVAWRTSRARAGAGTKLAA